ncbi:hypothetical protein ABZ714_05420 [Streptomyces sp. NPDC006798]|uniref:hypothetical protein n=1 Tax=Streptomyces sp. NPDC006798 TaxID=3155462 RepID=UPI003408DDC8
MVTSSHEAAHRIFQDRPELLSPVFRVLGVPLPEKTSIEVLTGDVTEIRPLERRVDSLLRVESSDGEQFLLAVEAQRRRDPEKAASWTYYLAYLKAKYGIPALLLVVCHDRATAKWAAGPFTTGVEGWTALSTRPMVVGPENLPVITSPREARQNLALASLSALTHTTHPEVDAILEALASALGSAAKDGESGDYFTELLEIGLGDTPAGAHWRNLMAVGTYFPGRGTMIERSFLKGVAEGQEKGREEGLAEGQAAERSRLILSALEKRGIPTTDDHRTRIADCTDLEVLDHWWDQVFTVDNAEELFIEGGEEARG